MRRLYILIHRLLIKRKISISLSGENLTEYNSNSNPTEQELNTPSSKSSNSAVGKKVHKNLMIICGPNGMAYESMAYTVND